MGSETMVEKPTHCEDCGERLTSEEAADPRVSGWGEVMCDMCWDEDNREPCGRCEEMADKTDLEAKPGDVIGVWRTAPGRPEDVEPGYYRVVRWPFYTDAMTSAWFDNEALVRVAPLDGLGRDVGEHAMYDSGPLCPDCQTTITTDSPTDTEGGE